LGYMPGGTRSFAQAISADGAVVVGQGDSLSRTFEAFRWTPTAGFEGLGALENGRPNSVAEDVSADGSVVVGYSFMETGSGNKAVRWMSGRGIEVLDSGDDPGQAYAVSGDGKSVVGTIYSAFESAGVIWHVDGQTRRLGYLPGRYKVTIPASMTGDGSVVVGTGWMGSGFTHEDRAFVWIARTASVT
jgi:probable HAF family extracellular repeat protein